MKRSQSEKKLKSLAIKMIHKSQVFSQNRFFKQTNKLQTRWGWYLCNGGASALKWKIWGEPIGNVEDNKSNGECLNN